MKDYVVGYPTFAYPSVRRTPTCLFLSLWTASSSMKTNCVADRRNSEFWQRIGQPYVRNPGRCFVAVVEIETDRCAVCLAELDAVQSEADRQAGVRRPDAFLVGYEGRQQTISRQWSIANKKRAADHRALLIQIFSSVQSLLDSLLTM